MKLKEIKNISVYWNSMSEMFIPTSVWDQSHELQYGVFELIEADLIHEMMKDIFTMSHGMSNSYVIDPFTVRIQFAFRNSYNQHRDDYKYRIALIQDKLRFNVNPITLSDFNKFRQYLEGQSYLSDL